MADELKVILFGAIFVALGVITRQIVLANGRMIPFHFVITISGILIGILGKGVSSLQDPLYMKEVGPHFTNIYITLLMFDGGLGTDVHYFRLMIYHLVVLIVPLFLLQYAVVVVIGIYLLPYDFSIDEYVMFMSVTLTPGPQTVKTFLTYFGASPDLKMMLQSETLFGNCIVWSIYKIAVLQQFTDTSKVAAQVVMDSVAGPAMGYFFGNLIIFWISRIFKDVVNQVTIVLGLVFSVTAICQNLGIASFISVVTVGLVMADQKASMTVKSMTNLTRFLDIIIFVLNSMTCIAAGIYVTTIIAPIITVMDILVAVLIFALTSILRALAFVVTMPLTRSYIPNKNIASIIWACNLRGSYSALMAMTLLDKNVYRRRDDTLFVVSMLQILLAFLINPALATYLMGGIYRKQVVLEKAAMIERAARILIDLKKSVLHTLQNSVFSADADWEVVYNYTKLRPDFMKRYMNSRWLKKKAIADGTKKYMFQDTIKHLVTEDKPPPVCKTKSSLVEEVQAVLESRMHRVHESIKQLVIAEKTCYSRQYELGIITRQSVIHLTYYVSECLKNKRLMDPNFFINRAKSVAFLQNIERDLVESIRKGPLHVGIRVSICLLYIFDLVTILYALMFIILNNMDVVKITLFTVYNCAFVIYYVCLVIYQAVVSKSWKPINMWHYIYRLLIIITLMDTGITLVPMLIVYGATSSVLQDNSDTSVIKYDIFRAYKSLSFIFILSRLCRSIQLVEIAPLLQKILLDIVARSQRHITFIEFDMAIGFKQGITDTMNKVAGIAADKDLQRDVNFIRHKCKLVIAQHIGLSQLQYQEVMSALKTKQAIRLTLNALEQALMEMKDMGLLGNLDEGLLRRVIETRMIRNRGFPSSIRLNPQISLLKHIPWVAQNSTVLHHIVDNGHIVRFLPGDIIVTQGHMQAGLFVILNGLVRGECLIEKENASHYLMLQRKRDAYISQNVMGAGALGQSELTDFHSRGNIIGELSFLTGKPGHKTFRCATNVETFFISNRHLANLMDGEPQPDRPMHQLEQLMWRTVAIRQAVRFIQCEPSSQNVSRILIQNRMSEAYIVDGNITRFVSIIPGEVSTVILIQGYAKQLTTDIKYAGPCIIPYYVQKLFTLPEKGLRVVFLFIKSPVLEEENINEGASLPDMEVSVLQEDNEDCLTISSGSSDGHPYRRTRNSVFQCDNKSVFITRLQQTAMMTGQRLSTSL